MYTISELMIILKSAQNYFQKLSSNLVTKDLDGTYGFSQKLDNETVIKCAFLSKSYHLI